MGNICSCSCLKQQDDEEETKSNALVDDDENEKMPLLNETTVTYDSNNVKEKVVFRIDSNEENKEEELTNNTNNQANNNYFGNIFKLINSNDDKNTNITHNTDDTNDNNDTIMNTFTESEANEILALWVNNELDDIDRAVEAVKIIFEICKVADSNSQIDDESIEIFNNACRSVTFIEDFKIDDDVTTAMKSLHDDNELVISCIEILDHISVLTEVLVYLFDTLNNTKVTGSEMNYIVNELMKTESGTYLRSNLLPAYNIEWKFTNTTKKKSVRSMLGSIIPSSIKSKFKNKSPSSSKVESEVMDDNTKLISPIKSNSLNIKTEVDLWLLDNQYEEYIEYFKNKGCRTLVVMRDFFLTLDFKDISSEYPELSKTMLFNLKKLLSKIPEDKIEYYQELRSSSSESIGDNNNNTL